MNRFAFSIGPLGACAVAAALLAIPGDSRAQDKSVTFEQHVAPILETRCAKCHGDGKLEAGLDVRRKFLLD